MGVQEKIDEVVSRCKRLGVTSIHMDGSSVDSYNDYMGVLDCIENVDKKFGSLDDLKKRMKDSGGIIDL